jgi:hypothetical protein
MLSTKPNSFQGEIMVRVLGKEGADVDEGENRHSAASPKYCKDMEKKYGWKLKRVEPNNDPILPVDCIFKGKQTSFQSGMARPSRLGVEHGNTSRRLRNV